MPLNARQKLRFLLAILGECPQLLNSIFIPSLAIHNYIFLKVPEKVSVKALLQAIAIEAEKALHPIHASVTSVVKCSVTEPVVDIKVKLLTERVGPVAEGGRGHHAFLPIHFNILKIFYSLFLHASTSP